MAINKIKCWHVEPLVYDIDAILKKKHDLELVRKSILKAGYRAFFLNEREEIETSKWYNDHLAGENNRFYIDGSGFYKLANIDLTEKELYFEKDRLIIGYKPWIFSSWQSDYTLSRSHINQALSEIINTINSTRKPRRTLELVESTRLEDGSKDIVSALKQNIDRSLIAVFDITNVAKVVNDNDEKIKTPNKYHPNSNVVFELSYALQKKGAYQIVIVKQQREDLDNDPVPFDFQQNKYCLYKQTDDLKRQLTRIVSNTLENMNYIYG